MMILEDRKGKKPVCPVLILPLASHPARLLNLLYRSNRCIIEHLLYTMHLPPTWEETDLSK